MTKTHENSESSQLDYTKTKRYALVDIGAKVVQAFAVLLLGILGLCFQASSERQKRADSDREASQREYLPELRSLTAVDLALLEASTQFSWPKYTDEEAQREARLGATLTYLGASLYFPKDEPAATLIPAADNVSKTATPHRIGTTVRESTLLLADFMRLAPLIREWRNKNSAAMVTVDGERLTIRDASKNEVLEAAVVDPRVAQLWRKWLSPQGINVTALYLDLDLSVYADELDARILEVCDVIIRKNRELAPDYIAIRNEILRSRANLLQQQ